MAIPSQREITNGTRTMEIQPTVNSLNSTVTSDSVDASYHRPLKYTFSYPVLTLEKYSIGVQGKASVALMFVLNIVHQDKGPDI
jgi:hypothetical protein